MTNVGVIQSPDIRLSTAGCVFCTLGTPPTLPATPAALYLTSWNAFGGLGRYSMEDLEAWEILNGITLGTQIVCANDVNTTATSMSCGVSWME